MTFTPTQAGHGTFAGVYHPAQAVTAAMVHPIMQQSQTMAGAVDMVGPGGSVYQPTQQAQINWPSNYWNRDGIFFLFHKQQNKKFKSNLGIFLGELKQVWIEGNVKKMQNWLDLSVNHPLQVGKS